MLQRVKMRNDAINMEVNEGLLAFGAEEEVAVLVVVHEEIFHKDCRSQGVTEEVEVFFEVGVGAGGVTVTTSTAEDLEHGGVKYFVSGKSVTVTLSGGSSYSAVDGASNPVALTPNGGGSYLRKQNPATELKKE